MASLPSEHCRGYVDECDTRMIVSSACFHSDAMYSYLNSTRKLVDFLRTANFTYAKIEKFC